PCEPFLLFYYLSQRSSNGREIFHKPPVEIGKSMKTPHLNQTLRRWPLLNSLHLLTIHLNSSRANNKSQEYYSINAKCTLLEIHIQFLLSQHIKNTSQCMICSSNVALYTRISSK